MIERAVVPIAVMLISTGGLFGRIENGILSDLLPASISALLLLLFLVSRGVPDFTRELTALTLLCLLAARNPGPELCSMAIAGTAFLAGTRLRFIDRSRTVIVTCAVLTCLWGVIQYVVIFPALIPHLEGAARDKLLSGRVFSTFILPAQFSAFLAMALCLAGGLAQVPGRYLYRLAGLIYLIGLYLAASLSGFVAAIAGITFLSGTGRRFVVLTILLFIFMGIAAISRPGVFSITGHTNPFSTRITNWIGTLEESGSEPIIGHGPGSFENIYLSGRRTSHADRVRHPHSWPLLVLYESGALGLVAWLLLAFGLFRPVRDRSYRAAAIAFFAASLFDVVDQSFSLRALGLFFLGASIEIKGAAAGAQPEIKTQDT